MNVPSWVHNRLVNPDGTITEEWEIMINQLLSQLNINFSDEGLVAPSQTTANINTIETNAQNGTLLYDSITNTLKVRLSDGSFHTIMTS